MKTIPRIVVRTGAIASGQLNRVYQGRSTTGAFSSSPHELRAGEARGTALALVHGGTGYSVLAQRPRDRLDVYRFYINRRLSYYGVYVVSTDAIAPPVEITEDELRRGSCRALRRRRRLQQRGFAAAAP